MRRTVPVAIVMVTALVVAAVSGLVWAATTVTVASPVNYAVGKPAVDVISADSDDDGYPDLAVSKFGSSSVSALACQHVSFSRSSLALQRTSNHCPRRSGSTLVERIRDDLLKAKSRRPEGGGRLKC